MPKLILWEKEICRGPVQAAGYQCDSNVPGELGSGFSEDQTPFSGEKEDMRGAGAGCTRTLLSEDAGWNREILYSVFCKVNSPEAFRYPEVYSGSLEKLITGSQ